MTDLRERINEDRGLLKKIQNLVPGFRGYRRREDLRDADAMLRIQLAERIGRVQRQVEDARAAAAENYMMGQIDQIGRLINQLETLEGEVRHAEQGYSDWAADIEIKEAELNALYDFDMSLLGGINSLGQTASEMCGAAQAEKEQELVEHQRTMKAQIRQLSDTFDRRIRSITGTGVV